jgi:hypothetical protein
MCQLCAGPDGWAQVAPFAEPPLYSPQAAPRELRIETLSDGESIVAAAKKTPSAPDEGYCVKCKAKRKISDAKEIKMANGRPALKGKCPVCGTGMFKILPPKKA